MYKKKLTVVFCLPGASFSGTFLKCFFNLMNYCRILGIEPILSQHSSSNVYQVRNLCLGANDDYHHDTKPFEGKLDYDYIMWIDSDVIFHPQQFEALLRHDKDIVSGIYFVENGIHFATARKWNESYFSEHGTMKFLKPDDLNNKKRLMQVSYTGMGFMLVKKGVFESFEFPWFRPLIKEINSDVCFTGEDTTFCLEAKKKGYKVYIDPNVIVGHQKLLVI